jgi:tetratricopeptide (TPR) repeat protein
LVPITGFDELMAKLLTKLREKGTVPNLYERLKDRARGRELNYEKQQDRLIETALALGPGKQGSGERKKTDQALSEAFTEIGESRKDKPWWIWFQEAEAAPDTDTKERIYQQGLATLPENAKMHRTYAGFLARQIKEPEKAEKHYLRALELDPDEPLALAFYADFLDRFRNEPDKVEHNLRRALKPHPKMIIFSHVMRIFWLINAAKWTKRKNYTRVQCHYTRTMIFCSPATRIF